ncbi:MAG: DUF4382 domain-containing protein [Gammaproteobacteria bacterium]|nr:DUF4382 domain-containing protein [Gammaproteobacteria bacterium]
MNWSTLYPELKRSCARLAAGISALTLAASVAVLPACQQNSKTASNLGSSSGSDSNLAIGLTDAKGDFISYTVDVKSLTLTKANGAIVETLPVTTKVDFAQYTDLTEFLTAATVPNGAYTSATMILDYSQANIQVEGDNGEAVKVGKIVDAQGKDISTLEVNVKFEGDKHKLVIAPGRPASLTLDFDLKASNTVSADQSSVTVEPYLLAEIESHKPKLHRLRGGLKSVDIANSSFDLILRPFAHELKDKDKHEHFGALNVITDANTVFDIDGVTYDGSSGLKTLNTMATFTAVVAIGDLKFNPRRFVAREVYAGSSVPGGILDVVTGNVIERAGNILTVKGATLVRKGGGMIFNDTVTVTVADTTKVHRQLSKDIFNIGAISVGQRVTVHGTLTDENPGSLKLDAANGSVRLLLTTLRGTVVSTNNVTHSLVMNLQTIDGRQVSLFKFLGTGIDSSNDADPAYYEINAGSMDLSGLSVGAPLAVRGFVTPFGSAPNDFVAQTLVDAEDVPTTMFVDWTPATATAFSSPSATSLTLNLAGSPLHEVQRAGVKTELSGAPVIQPSNDDDGMYFIKQNAVTQMYTSFANFTAGLQTRLSANAKVEGLVATGKYDDITLTLTTRFVAVSMK